MPDFYPVTNEHKPVTITTGGTTSTALDLRGKVACGLYMPGTFDGATVSYTVATVSGGSYQELQDGAGNKVTTTVSAGKYVRLDPNVFAGIQFIKVVSASSETTGGTDRTITIHCKYFS